MRAIVWAARSCGDYSGLAGEDGLDRRRVRRLLLVLADLCLLDFSLIMQKFPEGIADVELLPILAICERTASSTSYGQISQILAELLTSLISLGAKGIELGEAVRWDGGRLLFLL